MEGQDHGAQGLGWLFWAFFLMAGYKAWEDADAKRSNAQTSANNYQQQANYRQERIDKLQDALLVSSNRLNAAMISLNGNSNKVTLQNAVGTNIVAKTDSDNFTFSVSAPNNGNIANLKDSPGGSVTQIITNGPVAAKIWKRTTTVTNEPFLTNNQTAFRTKIHLTILTPSSVDGDTEITYRLDSPNRKILISPMGFERGEGGVVALSSGWFATKTVVLTFETSEAFDASQIAIESKFMPR